MNTIFKNLSEFFTQEEPPSNTYPQQTLGIDQSQPQELPDSTLSAERSPTSSLLSITNTNNMLQRKLSREAVGQFFTKVQSWFESSDEDDGLLAYSTEEMSYIPGFGIDMKEMEGSLHEVPRKKENFWDEKEWKMDEDLEDEVRRLARSKSFSEPPRGRKRSRSVEPKS
jgi:hypothetical protein